MAFHYGFKAKDVLMLTISQLTGYLDSLPRLTGADEKEGDLDAMSNDDVLQMVREGRL